MKKVINNRRHIPGELESLKFEGKRKDYEKYLADLSKMDYSQTDFMHFFPLCWRYDYLEIPSII